MRVQILQLDEKFVMPKKKEGYNRDFCYDVTAVSEEEIAPNVWKYGLGFAAKIVRDRKYDDYSLCIDFRPRSSIYKTGMVLSNSIGTIDEDYRGEISAVFYHVNTSLPRYHVGDRIGQIKLGFTEPMQFEIVEKLDETVRGTGGYGSTGK